MLLHKYGWPVGEHLIDAACRAMDETLEPRPRNFEKLRSSLRPLLETPPSPPKRRPRWLKHATQFCAADVMSIRLDGRYYAGYVLRIATDKSGTRPVVCFYDRVFDEPVTLDALVGCRAKGRVYRDSVVRPDRHALFGLEHLPDPAGQIARIAKGFAEAPDESHLGPAVGLYTASKFTDLQKILRTLFEV